MVASIFNTIKIVLCAKDLQVSTAQYVKITDKLGKEW